MPCNYKDYPANWKEIVAAKKVKHNNKCELCYAPNGVKVIRNPRRTFPWVFSHTSNPIEGDKETKIVLTVHHIDSDKTNNTDANLILSCQKCHLRFHLEGKTKLKKH